QVPVLCAHAATLRQGGVLHLEVESKLRRRRLNGAEGDALHVLGCAAGYNLRWLLRWIAFLRAWMGAMVWMSLRAVQRSTQAVGD
ncbi:hypothetical protein LL965_17945, partial [Xanthomonas cassavae CFBP 4642]|nr:hypothetical protein [Xanthomonas cassavae CFBP 4642]